MLNRKEIAKFLDLANHHQESTPGDIRLLCDNVKTFGFHTAFVNPCFVGFAREQLPEGKIGTVVSFPLGQDTQDGKVFSAMKSVKEGADELDVSMNVGMFKAGKYDLVLREMDAVVSAAKNIKRSTIVKFIIETGLLTDDEIKRSSELVLKSGADFVKTCSGMGLRGAELKDVDLIKSAIGDKIKIKVAGGINNFEEAVAFIEKGASRIGTSKAVEIVK